jgi:hypothetical protein
VNPTQDSTRFHSRTDTATAIFDMFYCIRCTDNSLLLVSFQFSVGEAKTSPMWTLTPLGAVSNSAYQNVLFITCLDVP